MTSELRIEGLRAGIASREILKGIDLVVRSGEVHAVMGPNGSGKSTLAHVLMGKPGYEVFGGRVTLDGVDLLELPTWQRAQAGLFLAMQYPIEVPGVSLTSVLGAPSGQLGALNALPLELDQDDEDTQDRPRAKHDAQILSHLSCDAAASRGHVFDIAVQAHVHWLRRRPGVRWSCFR